MMPADNKISGDMLKIMMRFKYNTTMMIIMYDDQIILMFNTDVKLILSDINTDKDCDHDAENDNDTVLMLIIMMIIT